MRVTAPGDPASTSPPRALRIFNHAAAVAVVRAPPHPPSNISIAIHKEWSRRWNAPHCDAGICFDDVPASGVHEVPRRVCRVTDANGSGDLDEGCGGSEDADAEEEGETDFPLEAELDVPN